MKIEDFIGPPCGCHLCTVAGVSNLEIRRDPWTGRWLHGVDLRRWYQARERFRALKQTTKPKGMK